MNHHHSFNEVFLTDARIPCENLVGAEGAGWKVARGTLAHERSFSIQRTAHFAPEASGRVVDEARAEAAEYLKTYEWYPQRMGRVDLVVVAGRASRGRRRSGAASADRPRCSSFQRASEWTAGRAKAGACARPTAGFGGVDRQAGALRGRTTRPTRSTPRIAGANGLLTETDDPVDAVIAEVLVSTPAQSIAGGTDEIQHNILGENILGLPKEPSVDRDRPFRDVGKNPGHETGHDTTAGHTP